MILGINRNIILIVVLWMLSLLVYGQYVIYEVNKAHEEGLNKAIPMIKICSVTVFAKRGL